MWPFVAQATIFPQPTPGSGQWGGTQSCQYDYYTADEIVEADSEVQSAKADLKSAKKKVKEQERTIKDIERNLKDLEKDISSVLTKGATQQVLDHLSHGGGTLGYKTCAESHPGSQNCQMSDAGVMPGTTTTLPQGNSAALNEALALLGMGGASQSGPKTFAGGSGSTLGGSFDVRAGVCRQFSADVVNAIKSRNANAFGNNNRCINLFSPFNNGDLSSNGTHICEYAALQKSSNKVSRRQIRACKKAVEKYADEKADLDEYENELAELESAIGEAEDLLDDKRDEVAEDLEDSDRWIEADCKECREAMYKARPTTWDKVSRVLGFGLGVGGAIWAQDRTNKLNARAGWPSSSYGAISAAYPLMAYGMYGGAMGGIAGGGYGCAGTAGQTGFGPYGTQGLAGTMWGYPNSFYGPQWGGGLYNQMGPWGAAGPWSSMSPYGYPIGAMGAVGAMGVMGQYNNPYFPGGINGPMGGMASLGAFGGINPMANLGAIGAVGAIGGYGAIGGMNPMANLGAIGGYGAIGGMNPMANLGAIGALSGYPIGALGAMGTPGVYNNLGIGAVGAIGAIGGNSQYSQQLMMMQQQQQEQYFAAVQRQQQSQQAAARTINDLYGQIMQLQNQIQSTYQGLYSGGGTSIVAPISSGVTTGTSSGPR